MKNLLLLAIICSILVGSWAFQPQLPNFETYQKKLQSAQAIYRVGKKLQQHMSSGFDFSLLKQANSETFKAQDDDDDDLPDISFGCAVVLGTINQTTAANFEACANEFGSLTENVTMLPDAQASFASYCTGDCVTTTIPSAIEQLTAGCDDDDLDALDIGDLLAIIELGCVTNGGTYCLPAFFITAASFDTIFVEEGDGPPQITSAQLDSICTDCFLDMLDSLLTYGEELFGEDEEDDDDDDDDSVSPGDFITINAFCLRENNQYCYLEFLQAVQDLSQVNFDTGNDGQAPDINLDPVLNVVCRTGCFRAIVDLLVEAELTNGNLTAAAELESGFALLRCEKNGGRFCVSLMFNLLVRAFSEISPGGLIATCPITGTGDCDTACRNGYTALLAPAGCCVTTLGDEFFESIGIGIAFDPFTLCSITPPDECETPVASFNLIVNNMDCAAYGANSTVVNFAVRRDVAANAAVRESGITVSGSCTAASSNGFKPQMTESVTFSVSIKTQNAEQAQGIESRVKDRLTNNRFGMGNVNGLSSSFRSDPSQGVGVDTSSADSVSDTPSSAIKTASFSLFTIGLAILFAFIQLH